LIVHKSRFYANEQSGFEKFVRDKYTILPETSERMLATEVNASWRYELISDVTFLICD